MRLLRTLPPAAMLIMASAAGAAQYSSDAHGLVADLPKRLTICLAEEPAPNHGFVVPLAPATCDDPQAGPRIVFWVAYNVVDEYRTAADMRTDICGNAHALPSRLRVAGARLLTSALPPDRGFERTVYFGVRPRAGEHVSRWTEITITAVCLATMMPRCRALAAEIAGHVRARKRN